MKRILLRISALAVVVVLGLIAMAQAQLYLDQPDASGAATPAKLPPVVNSNPLRPEPSAPVYTDVRQASAESSVLDGSGGPTPAVRPAIENPPVSTEPNPTPPAGAASGRALEEWHVAPPTTTELPPVGPPAGSVAPEHPTNELPRYINNNSYIPDASPDSTTAPPPTAVNSQLGRPAPVEYDPPPSQFPASGQAVPATSQPGFASRQPVVADRQPEGEPSSRYDRSFQPQRFSPDSSAAPMARSLQPGANPYAGLRDSRNVAGSMGTGTPGDRKLDGPQAPQLTVEKTAPAEIRVGEPAIFQITVRNSGTIAAAAVEIHDEVPAKTQLRATTPRASQEANGKLVWRLGSLEPGQEATVEMELMPVEKGPEVGSVATVHFQTTAAARAVCTQPLLTLHVADPQPVRVGEDLILQITIANPGDGVTSNVIIENQVPPNFEHPQGAELKYELGDLQPGEQRKLDLKLSARQKGPAENVLVARAGPDLRAENRKPLEVVEPRLSLSLQGPSRRYLEREAVYTIEVENEGTASARLVQLATQLPQGMQFVSADNNGFYDEAKRTVYWSIQELPRQEVGRMSLTTLPTAPGEQVLRCETSDSSGMWDKKEHPVLVEGVAAIFFEVADVADPIEVGEETTYEIRVVNQGTKSATNVQVIALLQPGLQAISAEGPTPHALMGDRITFKPLPRLAPKADQTYYLRVRGVVSGDQRLKVQLTTDDLRTPVTKEESTRVYADE